MTDHWDRSDLRRLQSQFEQSAKIYVLYDREPMRRVVHDGQPNKFKELFLKINWKIQHINR